MSPIISGLTTIAPGSVTLAQLALPLAQISQSTPADPTGTTSIAGVMMGLAGSITPKGTRVYVVFRGGFWNTSAGTATTIQPRYGTGAAPVNGAALTGTAIGGGTGAIYTAAANPAPFAVGGTITGLTAGTAYWLDVSVASSSASFTSTIRSITIDCFDIL